MKVFYTDHFVLPLPEGHSFPMEKYALLRQRLLTAQIVRPEETQVPLAATESEILRAHDPLYLYRVLKGELTPREIRRIGLPWSIELVERATRSCGATIGACRSALQDGLGVSLSGGTHHAFPDKGEGYCVFNDTAVAARAMQAEGLVERVVIIDCDVHQGDGTAAIFAKDPTVFTFSIHGKNNFPFHKEKSDLDIPLDDGTNDEAYLRALKRGGLHALDRAKAELMIYIAGADPYVDDRFGRLSLTKAGLVKRDRMVFGYSRDMGIPIAVTMGGGYARQVKDTVDIHFQTVAAAVQFYRRMS